MLQRLTQRVECWTRVRGSQAVSCCSIVPTLIQTTTIANNFTGWQKFLEELRPHTVIVRANVYFLRLIMLIICFYAERNKREFAERRCWLTDHVAVAVSKQNCVTVEQSSMTGRLTRLGIDNQSVNSSDNHRTERCVCRSTLYSLASHWHTVWLVFLSSV